MAKEINFYILNKNEGLTGVLSTAKYGEHLPVYTATVDEKLDSYDILTLTIPADKPESSLIKEDYSIIFEDVSGWREYIVSTVEDIDGPVIEKEITAELSSVELLDEVLEENFTGSNATDTLGILLAGTRWKVGTVDSSIYSSKFTTEVQYLSVLEAITELSRQYNCEVAFSYSLDQNRIKDRFVNLYSKRGSDKGKRFEIDKDVIEIKRTIDTSDIKTAIIPYGIEQDTEEGAAPKRFDIKNVVWSKASGDPVDKPLGQSWLGDPTALSAWGKTNIGGSKRHRFIALEIETDTEAQLATMGWVNLGKYTEPKVTYEAKVIDLYSVTEDEELRHEYVSLGDLVSVIDYYFSTPLAVQTRVVELFRDLLDPSNNEVVLGNSKQTFSVQGTADKLDELQGQINRVENIATNIVQPDGSTTYYGSAKPATPAEGDSWFRPHPDKPNEKQLLIYNGTVWEIVNDTSVLNEMAKQYEQVEKDLVASKAAADAAVSKSEAADIKADAAVVAADKAVKEAGFSTTAAEEAKAAAVGAIGEASAAKVQAATAVANSNKAVLDSSKAIVDSQKAITDSGSAITKAEQAISDSGVLGGKVSTNTLAISKTNTALTSKADTNVVDTLRGTVTAQGTLLTQTSEGLKSKAETSTVNTLKGTVATQGTLLTQTAEGLMSKATTAEVNTLKGTITTQGTLLTQTADSLKSKADTTVVDTLKGTVTTQGTLLTQTAAGLKSKAESTTVDSLTGKVNSQGTLITQNATAISSKAATTEVNSLKGTVTSQGTLLTQTAAGLKAKAEQTEVNTLSGKVNTNSTSISANAKEIAARLTSTQVETLVNGKGYVTTTALNATSSSLSASIVEVSTDLANLEIGGRNLVLLSRPLTTNNNYVLWGYNLSVPVISGEDYTVSLKGTIDSSFHTGFYVNVHDGTNYPELVAFTEADKQNNGSYRKTVKMPISNGTIIGGNVYGSPLGLGKIATLEWLKIEKGNKGTDWSPAPEDLATVERAVQIEANLNGLQTTVKNKAEQSQVTQLAGQVSSKVESSAYNSKMTQLDSQITSKVASATYNSKMTQLDSQITSKVSSKEMETAISSSEKNINLSVAKVATDLADLEIGGRNLLERSATKEFEKQYTETSEGYTGFKQLTITHVDEKLSVGEVVTLSFNVKMQVGTQLNVYDSNNNMALQFGTKMFSRVGMAERRLSWTFTIKAGKGSSIHTLDFFNSNNPDNFSISKVKIEKGNKATDWSPAPEDNVSKSDIMTQLNLNPEGILLQGKNIQLDGNVTMTTAFINSIKAIDISADRITAGTLNATKVNIINLNAESITAGIIKGTNLSINLGTGDVVFQKGIIKRPDNQFSVDVTNARIESYNSKGGFTIQDGSIRLYRNPLLGGKGTPELYGSIEFMDTIFNGKGVGVSGTLGAILKTKDWDMNIWDTGTAGSAILADGNSAKMHSFNASYIYGGPNLTDLGRPASISVGTYHEDDSKRDKDINLSARAVSIHTKAPNKMYKYRFWGEGELQLLNALNQSHFSIRATMGNFGSASATWEMGGSSFSQVYDSAGAYLQSTTLANRTSSAGANVYVRDDGIMYRTTSASKYKLNISEIPDVEDYSRKILELKPKQWFDKAAVEGRVLEIDSKGKKTRVDSSAITPYYGLIAEDLVDLGLTKYVSYGADGKEVEGIMYDRLWTLLIPVVKEHDLQLAEQDSQIAKLNTKLSDQTRMINQLFAEITKLKGDM